MKNRGVGLLEAIAYGDAAGLPVETWSSEKIRSTYGWLETLIPTSNNDYFAGEHEPGTWSDDTQLSLAVAQSLIDAGGFSMASMAYEHIRVYEATPTVELKGKRVPRGWGGSTVNSVQRLMQGSSPQESGEKDGAGNGVLMKLAPLVLWQVLQDVPAQDRYQQYDMLTTMTHDSDVARLCSRVHGNVLYELLKSGGVEADYVTATAKEQEANGSSYELSSALGYLCLPTHSKPVETVLFFADGKGFYAPQTLAMAYGAYFLSGAGFAEKVYTAVNCGGDTDSTASITAAMVWCATDGNMLLPSCDAHLLKQKDLLQRVSYELTYS